MAIAVDAKQSVRIVARITSPRLAQIMVLSTGAIPEIGRRVRRSESLTQQTTRTADAAGRTGLETVTWRRVGYGNPSARAMRYSALRIDQVAIFTEGKSVTRINWETVNAPEWLESRTIMLVRAGSHAYGTNIESSDEDYRGVAIAPLGNYLGIRDRFEQFESKDPDLVVYEFRKFVTLASQANPNILELLFVDESDVIEPRERGKWDPPGSWFAGRELLAMRGLFVTKRAVKTFSGYATSQLKKIRHNTEHSIPGSARYELIQKFGYCTKNAMHLVRMLRMQREILETGQVNVRRTDAAELLDIRNGKWTLAELVEYAEQMEKELPAIVDRCTLPEMPDMEEIDRRCVTIMKEALECI